MGIEYQRINGKEYVSLRRYYNLLCKCKTLEEENKKLNVIIENNNSEQKADWKHIEELEEENKTLKDKIEFLTNCLDDRDKSIELLKEELKQYKKQYEHTMGEY